MRLTSTDGIIIPPTTTLPRATKLLNLYISELNRWLYGFFLLITAARSLKIQRLQLKELFDIIVGLKGIYYE
jgi:hypothetical protein